ncbi:pyruvate formate lyase activating enzyme [Candidatus Magnetomoraceae bacterium gMMP-15]
MIFGGLQKNSMIDYPGKISCVLFSLGCNFDCPYCHNPELVHCQTEGYCPHNQEIVKEETVMNFLQKRNNFLQGVVISGGEPTLQKDFITTCKKIKSMGYPVKLDTNGSKTEILKQVIEEELVDYIAMDIKTIPEMYTKYIKKNYHSDCIFSSIETIMDSNIDYEFRTTCVKPIVDASVIEKIAALIQGAAVYAIQQFVPTEMLHPEFFNDQAVLYEDKDLYNFQNIAAHYVKKCIVRN